MRAPIGIPQCATRNELRCRTTHQNNDKGNPMEHPRDTICTRTANLTRESLQRSAVVRSRPCSRTFVISAANYIPGGEGGNNALLEDAAQLKINQWPFTLVICSRGSGSLQCVRGAVAKVAFPNGGMSRFFAIFIKIGFDFFQFQ